MCGVCDGGACECVRVHASHVHTCVCFMNEAQLPPITSDQVSSDIACCVCVCVGKGEGGRACKYVCIHACHVHTCVCASCAGFHMLPHWRTRFVNCSIVGKHRVWRTFCAPSNRFKIWFYMWRYYKHMIRMLFHRKLLWFPFQFFSVLDLSEHLIFMHVDNPGGEYLLWRDRSVPVWWWCGA